MGQGVRHYTIRLTTVGPVHVGTGSMLGKKDYFVVNEGKSVAVLDVRKFVSQLNDAQLGVYCAFLEEDTREGGGLEDFLDEHRELRRVAEQSLLYRVNMRLVQNRKGSYRYFDVFECVKDPDGRPYIPGSSVKGVLRTALLQHLIASNRVEYANLYQRETCLKHEREADRDIDEHAFWVERNGQEEPNDIMRYVSVSDSDPLDVKDLAFVQKYDLFSRRDTASHKRNQNGRCDTAGNRLNVYRESIRPGAEVTLSLDIDPRIDQYLDGFKLDRAGLERVLQEAAKIYDETFASHFDIPEQGASAKKGSSSGGKGSDNDTRCQFVYESGPLKGRRCRNTAVAGTSFCAQHQGSASASHESTVCYVGGGVGFASKTVEGALFPDDRGASSEAARVSIKRVDEVSHILYEQFPTKLDVSRYGSLKREVQDAGFSPMQKQYRGRQGKEDHRHWKDCELHVSPHTLKMGTIGSSSYEMGKCRIRVEER